MQVCQGSSVTVTIAGLALCMNIKLQITPYVMPSYKALQRQFQLEKYCSYSNSYELRVTRKQSQRCRFKLTSIGANEPLMYLSIIYQDGWEKNIAKYVFAKYLIRHVDISILKSYVKRANFQLEIHVFFIDKICRVYYIKLKLCGDTKYVHFSDCSEESRLRWLTKYCTTYSCEHGRTNIYFMGPLNQHGQRKQKTKI